jgi:hypothetical protein
MTGVLLTFDSTTTNKDSDRVSGQCLALLATKVHRLVTFFQGQLLLIHLCNCSLVFPMQNEHDWIQVTWTVSTVYECTVAKAMRIIGSSQESRIPSTDVIEFIHWLKISLRVCTSKVSLILYCTHT